MGSGIASFHDASPTRARPITREWRRAWDAASDMDMIFPVTWAVQRRVICLPAASFASRLATRSSRSRILSSGTQSAWRSASTVPRSSETGAASAGELALGNAEGDTYREPSGGG